MRKISTHNLKFLLLIPLSIIIMSCSKQETVTIKIFETSDVHGAIFPYDFNTDKEVDHSLAQLMTYIKQERANKEQEVILLDNGDILQGQPIVYYSNFVKTKQEHICAKVMNYMGYDAATVGNHDIEAGHDVYDKLVDEFDFPWMAANAMKEDGTTYFQPYHIIKRKGFKIAILSLITPAIPNWLPEQIWSGMEYTDMLESARDWMEILQKNEKPDLIIGLFHSGLDYTNNNQDEHTYKNENAVELVAQKVAGFDIIFAGHDHQAVNKFIEGPNKKSVLILDPDNSAKFMAEATIVFTYNEDSKEYEKEISGNLIASNNFIADSDFMATFQSDFEEVKSFVSTKIGVFSKSIDSKESFFGPAAFTDLIHKIQLEITNADISFTAPLSYNSVIDSGEIYIRDMFRLYKYENLLYTMSLSGQEIKDALEYAYGLRFDVMKKRKDHLMLFEDKENEKLRLKNAFYNFESAAGIQYTVDVTKEIGHRVQILSLTDKRIFDPTETYQVAINSYRGQGGGGHLTIGSGIQKDSLADRILTSTEVDLRYLVMKWIEENSPVNPETLNNWKVIPEKYGEAGKKLDWDILF
ncbi:MAG: bifunctional metallophosphatase/5'-nucleotidase [Cytophagia bacterium]|nr:bifunctional metallophosphatase/5'-nucleotidase [Cytophagia bacterium]